MKRVILSSILLTSSVTIAMDKPEDSANKENNEALYTLINGNILNIKKEQTNAKGHYPLRAYINDEYVGALTYKFLKNDTKTAKMLILNVSEKYRQLGIGSLLFKKSVEVLKKVGIEKLIWDAIPIPKDLKIDDLITIYKNMVRKLNFSKSSLKVSALIKGEGARDWCSMELDLNSKK